MSQRDLLWFFGGASMACAIGAVLLWVVLSGHDANANNSQASLPSWHPPTRDTATAPGADLHTVAGQMRRQRNYPAALEAYAALEKQSSLTADEWADYADVSASLQNGALGGEPARLIGEALKADPAHPKALWLQASLAHQQGRYQDALGWWQKLRAQIPADSPDQRIITANIDEATRLMAGNGNATPPSASRAPELDVRFGLLLR